MAGPVLTLAFALRPRPCPRRAASNAARAPLRSDRLTAPKERAGGGAGRHKGDGPQARRQHQQPQQQQQQQQQPGGQQNRRGGHSRRGGGHAGGRCEEGMVQNGGTHEQRMPPARPGPVRAQPPPPSQQQHGAPASFRGFDPSLSLAQALGQVLELYSGTLATEADVDAKMRQHPQGANWRSCLEVMVEQSVRHGALHPECPDIRQSVHCAAVRGAGGAVSMLIMVSHPAAAPFKFYCECGTPCQCVAPVLFPPLSKT